MKTKRVYNVVVREIASFNAVESNSFSNEQNPSAAKESALKQAQSYKDEYLYDKENLSLMVMVTTDEGTLYLDYDGNEDTQPIDWFE